MSLLYVAITNFMSVRLRLLFGFIASLVIVPGCRRRLRQGGCGVRGHPVLCGIEF